MNVKPGHWPPPPFPALSLLASFFFSPSLIMHMAAVNPPRGLDPIPSFSSPLLFLVVIDSVVVATAWMLIMGKALSAAYDDDYYACHYSFFFATVASPVFAPFWVADSDFSQGDLATLAGRKLASPDLASGELRRGERERHREHAQR